jgi:cytochrome P450
MTLSAPSLNSLPGPRPVPLLGRRANKLIFYRDPIAYHRAVYQTYGTLAAFVQGGSKVLMYAPEYYRQVLTQTDVFHNNLTLPGAMDTALYRLGSGLTSMNGEYHRQQRRLLKPAFHKQQVEAHRDVIVAITQRHLDGWRLGAVYDMARELHDLTLTIAGTTLLGIDMHTRARTLAHLIDDWLGMLASMAVLIFPVDLPYTPYRRLLALSKQVEEQLQAMIAERRAQAAPGHDALSILIGAADDDGTRMTDAELIGQVALLFMAGFETSAVVLAWTLFLLVQHPPVLADLLDELDGVLHGDAPSVEQLTRLPLLDGVIKESLRLLPPASQGGRTSTQPFELGGHAFPAGTKVMWSQYITHHMPDFYPEPDRFVPQRWRTIEPAPYTYLPFLAGPRMCLGAAFATLEMKLVVAMIVQRYRLALHSQTIVDYQVKFTLSPKHGIPVQVYPQDRQFKRVAVSGNIHELVALG